MGVVSKEGAVVSVESPSLHKDSFEERCGRDTLILEVQRCYCDSMALVCLLNVFPCFPATRSQKAVDVERLACLVRCGQDIVSAL